MYSPLSLSVAADVGNAINSASTMMVAIASRFFIANPPWHVVAAVGATGKSAGMGDLALPPQVSDAAHGFDFRVVVAEARVRFCTTSMSRRAPSPRKGLTPISQWQGHSETAAQIEA